MNIAQLEIEAKELINKGYPHIELGEGILKLIEAAVVLAEPIGFDGRMKREMWEIDRRKALRALGMLEVREEKTIVFNHYVSAPLESDIVPEAFADFAVGILPTKKKFSDKFSKPCPHFPDRPCYPALCINRCQDARMDDVAG